MPKQVRIKVHQRAQQDPILGHVLGTWADGYSHTLGAWGCTACGCGLAEWHYKLMPKHRDTPIYDRLMRARAYFGEAQ